MSTQTKTYVALLGSIGPARGVSARLPWFELDDARRMEAYLGALAPDRAAVLRPALKTTVDSPETLWSSWALRVSALFQVPSPEAAAAAISLLLDPNHSVDQAALAVALLEDLGLARADVGAVLLDAALAPPPVPALPGAEALEDSQIPRKVALLWGLAALASRQDPRPWMRLAAGLAEPIALLFGLVDLIDGSSEGRAGPPRIGAVLRACKGVPEALSALRGVCAGSFDPGGSLLTNGCAALTNPATLLRLDVYRDALLTAARALLPERDPGPGEAFLSALAAAFSGLDAPLWVRAIALTVRPTAVWTPADAELDVRAAVDYLQDTRPWRGAWNVHRFRPFGAPDVLVGRTFVEGLILLLLSETWSDQRLAIAGFLSQIPDGEARYYSDWRGLPPDVDTLRVLMQLACLVDSPPRARIESWIELINPNLDENGVAPTWLERGPQGRTCALQGPFLGNDCTAARLAFLLGCVSYDAQRFEAILRANLRSVLSRLRGGVFEECVHYTPSFARYLFFGIERELSRRSPEVAREFEVERIAADLRADLLASQRADGGWGSPQETAFALTALSLAGVAPDERRWAMKNLSETQGPDGAWPAEPFYITPGKRGGMVPLARKEVTTAFCARALHAALVAERLVGGEMEYLPRSSAR